MITSKIKNYAILILFILVLISSIVAFIFIKRLRIEQNEYSNLYNNFDALKLENTGLNEKARVYKLTIEDLVYLQDSITIKLLSTMDSLKIKESKIKSLQYYLEHFTKRDTVIFKDTIFIPELNIDTTLKYPYYNLFLHLEYPNTIITEPSIFNEKEIFVANERVTIKPPKKYWIQRIFQKKHTILTIDIVDKNPYMTTKKQRFIEIIK